LRAGYEKIGVARILPATYILAMNANYPTLTEKEKQTLRLLVSGHEAKSMARELGLSVHTVNERLRDARRKMAVSSSREAARLLREAERDAPQSLGDKHLGDASAPAGVQTTGSQRTGGAIVRRRWLIGAPVMTSLLAAAYTLATLSGVAAPAAPSAEATATANQATGAARAFLSLVDARDWSSSYAATAQTFRQVNTESLWAEVSQKVYQPLGALRSRTLAEAEFVPAPPNGVWIIKFRASFANRASAVETLALAHEDGNYKVTGIFVE
jgi:DNA-binding CsgD family transcriptional regulator